MGNEGKEVMFVGLCDPEIINIVFVLSPFARVVAPRGDIIDVIIDDTGAPSVPGSCSGYLVVVAKALSTQTGFVG